MRPVPAQWADMSNYVVHFTKNGTGYDAIDSMMSIYWDHELKPGRSFGLAYKSAPAGASQEAVCFSEIPPGQWTRIVERRESQYGLAFTKEFILQQGGGPIWYAWKDSPHWHALNGMMADARGNPNALIWKITPMIDAPGEYSTGDFQFDWEREWRIIGSLKFEFEDVAFLFIPERLHANAERFFEEHRRHGDGPVYDCPFIDPHWDADRIMAGINNYRMRFK